MLIGANVALIRVLDSFYVFREPETAPIPSRVPASSLESLNVVTDKALLKPFSLAGATKPLATLTSPKSGLSIHFTSNRQCCVKMTQK